MQGFIAHSVTNQQKVRTMIAQTLVDMVFTEGNRSPIVTSHNNIDIFSFERGIKLEKLCGKCSQSEGLTLEQRVELAQSRIPNAVYRCPICSQEHLYIGNIVKLPTPIETVEEKGPGVEKKNPPLRTNNTDQLSLF
jgi:hypothetical protein